MPGITRSVSTRSILPLRKASRACWPLLQATTRYPRVSSRIFRIERACSLSSTHKIVFLGFMGDLGVRTPPTFFFIFENFESELHANGNRVRGKVARSPMAPKWTERWGYAPRFASGAE